jgi:DNA-directed RNA polymerase specialized sigma24 family protein
MESATTVNNIIEHVFTSSTYTQIITKMMYNSALDYSLLGDVKQEIILQLAECKTDLVNVYNKGDFKWFFIRICSNQIKSDKSYLFYKYIKKEKITDEYQDCNSEAYEMNLEYKIDLMNKYNKINNELIKQMRLSRDNKRNITLYKMYVEDDLSMGEISKKTGIPKTSVHKYISEARGLIETLFS